MQKKIFVLGIGTVLMLFLFSLFIYRYKINEHKQLIEKLWYVQNLDYNFCCVVESISKYSKMRGDDAKVSCRLNSKQSNIYSNEDSLQLLLNEYEYLRFVLNNLGTELVDFRIQGYMSYKQGDSICVDSQDGKIYIYRNNELKSIQNIHLLLVVK